MKACSKHKDINILRRTHLPYCVHKQANGSYILLNRYYVPLGVLGEFDMEKDSKNFEFYFARMTPITAAKISWNNKPDVDKIFLYHDGCPPTVKEKYTPLVNGINSGDYFTRLEHLMRLKIRYN